MRLRVLTLNVWGLPSPLSHRPDDRMQAIGEALPEHRLDVAGFQEVWTISARDTLVEAGRRAGMPHAWHRTAGLGGSGLLVLSRWPISQRSFESFALCGLPERLGNADYYGGKGFAFLELATPAGALGVVNTHLHSPDAGDDSVDDYLGHRVAETIEIATRVAGSPLPFVLLGDLNARPHDSSLEVLQGITRMIDAAAVVGRAEPTAVRGSLYRRQRRRPSKRVDYVFTRSGAGIGVTPRSALRVLDGPLDIAGEPATYSDHSGVLTEIEIGGPGAPLAAPDIGTIHRARGLLDEGRSEALFRRDGQRSLAAASGAIGLALGTGSAVTKRGFLHGVTASAATLMLGSSLIAGALSEGFVPSELDAYDRVEALLDDLLVLRDERLGREIA